MLGVCNATTIAEIWDNTESKVVLSTSAEEFFAESGLQPNRTNSRRSHQRYYLRCRTIIKCAGQTHAVYLRDISRTGMGLMSPVQLFPCQHVQLWTDIQRSYQLEIIRCRRIGPNCYECGTVFLLK